MGGSDWYSINAHMDGVYIFLLEINREDLNYDDD